MKQSRFNLFAAAVLAVATSAPAFAVDRVRNATANPLIDDAAWDTVAPTSSDRAVWNGTSVGGATTLGGDASWSGILISAGTPTSGPLFTNAANGTLFTLTLGSGGIDLNNGTSTNRGITFDTNTKLDLAANQTWKLGLGGTSANIIASSVVSGASSLEVTRDAAGSNYAQFGAANTFSGGFTAGANSWVRVAATSLTSGTSVTNGPLGVGNLTLNEGALLSSSSGSGYVLAFPQINVAGNITLSQASGGTGRLQIAGTWDLGGATRIVTLGKPSTGTNAPYASGLEVFNFNRPTTGGNFSVPAVQNGTLSLATTTGTAATPSVARIGSGGTTSFVNNAGLSLGDGVALTSGTGTFFGTGTNAPVLALSAPVANGGGILQMGDGTSGGNAVVRSAEIHSLSGGGTVSSSNTTGTAATGTLTISNGNGANFSGAITETGGTGRIALTKSGAGTQTLSGISAYTGKTTVSGGVLKIAKTTALYNNTPASWTDTNLQVDSGATLAFNVGGAGEFTSSDIQSLAALGTGTGGFKTGAKIGIDTTNATGGVFTYSSVLANPNSGANTLGLRKLGTGTLALDQTNTFSGGTIVDAGTVRITQPGGLGTGSLVVNSGAGVEADLSGITGPASFPNATTGTGTITVTPPNNVLPSSGIITFTSGLLTSFVGTINVNASPLQNSRVDFNGLIASGSTINIDTGATARLVASAATYTGVTINVKGPGGSGPGALRMQNNTLDSLCAVNLTGDASIGSFTVTSTIDAVIADGGNNYALSKAGDSTLVLNAVNTYGGDTNVNGGTLRIAEPYLADASDVAIASTGVLDLNFDETSGQVTDTVATLTIAGVQKAAGVYGATGSGAAIIDDTHFAGIGTLTVTNGPAPSSAYDTWASGFGLSGGNAAFDADPDGDGVKNGLEWILGGNPNTSSTSAVPAVSRDLSGNLVLTFTRREDSITEGTLTLEYGPNLASFANSYVIDADGGTDANGVVVSINQTASPDAVTVTIPPSAVPGGRVFARLKAVRN